MERGQDMSEEEDLQLTSAEAAAEAKREAKRKDRNAKAKARRKAKKEAKQAERDKKALEKRLLEEGGANEDSTSALKKSKSSEEEAAAPEIETGSKPNVDEDGAKEGSTSAGKSEPNERAVSASNRSVSESARKISLKRRERKRVVVAKKKKPEVDVPVEPEGEEDGGNDNDGNGNGGSNDEVDDKKDEEVDDEVDVEVDEVDDEEGEVDDELDEDVVKMDVEVDEVDDEEGEVDDEVDEVDDEEGEVDDEGDEVDDEDDDEDDEGDEVDELDDGVQFTKTRSKTIHVGDMVKVANDFYPETTGATVLAESRKTPCFIVQGIEGQIVVVQEKHIEQSVLPPVVFDVPPRLTVLRQPVKRAVMLESEDHPEFADSGICRFSFVLEKIETDQSVDYLTFETDKNLSRVPKTIPYEMTFVRKAEDFYVVDERRASIRRGAQVLVKHIERTFPNKPCLWWIAKVQSVDGDIVTVDYKEDVVVNKSILKKTKVPIEDVVVIKK